MAAFDLTAKPDDGQAPIPRGQPRIGQQWQRVAVVLHAEGAAYEHHEGARDVIGARHAADDPAALAPSGGARWRVGGNKLPTPTVGVSTVLLITSSRGEAHA